MEQRIVGVNMELFWKTKGLRLDGAGTDNSVFLISFPVEVEMSTLLGKFL